MDARQVLDSFKNSQKALKGEQFYYVEQKGSDGKIKVTVFTESLKNLLTKQLQEAGVLDQVKVSAVVENEGPELEVVNEPINVYIASHNEAVENLADQLQKGERIKVLTEIKEDGWVAIQIHHDFEDQVPKQYGWVKYHSGDFRPALKFQLNKNPKPFNEKQFLDEIRNFLSEYSGIKYVYGGKAKQLGYDCSGLTQIVIFNLTGVRMPRISQLQAKLGREVVQNQIKSGDLVYFYSNTENRIRHIGFVYKVDHKNAFVQFVHSSPTANGIVMDNLKEPKWLQSQNHLSGFRRII